MDWAKIIKELQDAGLVQREIADIVGCSQGLISQIKNKSLLDPCKEIGDVKKSKISYEIGAALIELHKKMITENY